MADRSGADARPTRLFCSDILRPGVRAGGLETNFVQHSTSYSSHKGTLRGLHLQRAPHAEVKIVRCLKGAIWDVIIDLRRDSPTYREWQAFELTADNGSQLYVPAGFAHGFQTLCDDTEAGYLISAYHVPSAACGIRYDDPAFAIAWPLPPGPMSTMDKGWSDFSIHEPQASDVFGMSGDSRRTGDPQSG